MLKRFIRLGCCCVFSALLCIFTEITMNKAFADPVEDALHEARQTVSKESGELKANGHAQPDKFEDKAMEQPATPLDMAQPVPEAGSQTEPRDADASDSEISAQSQPAYPGVINCRYIAGAEGGPSVSLNYPEVGNQEIDNVFKKFALELGEGFEKDAKDAREPVEDEPGTYSMWEMSGTYAIEKPNPDIISVTFNIYSFMGGAHGDLRVIVMNYDLKTGKKIEFSDLFRDPREAVSILGRLSEEKLRKILGDDVEEEMLKDGTAPVESNFSNLSLLPDGVAVEFQPYQVGPWAIGQQHIEVSLEELLPAGPSKIIWPSLEAR